MVLGSFQVLLLYSLLLSSNLAGGDRKLLSMEELDIEEQLKLLNKPAVKTIKMEYGDIYDCVDFYKQPAFDHHLLKNHNFHFQMRPTIPLEWRNHKIFLRQRKYFHIRPKGVGCPVGTVPIRRTTRDDLIRAKSFSKRIASNLNPFAIGKPGNHYAVVRTRFDPNKKYKGVGGRLTLYNPRTKAFQFSSGQIKIQNGPDLIQVGWTVNQNLYGDNRTRLFTFFNAGESYCFNTRCPGFVIVNTEIPLDFVLEPVSKRGGPIYTWAYLIIQDEPSGNWWLQVGNNNTIVGFWPKRIFTGLANLATHTEWGGQVYSLPGEPSPPMGSGYYVLRDTEIDAYCSDIVVVNESLKIVDARDTEEFVDNEKYYSVDDRGFTDRTYRHLVYFGGPGGAVS